MSTVEIDRWSFLVVDLVLVAGGCAIDAAEHDEFIDADVQHVLSTIGPVLTVLDGGEERRGVARCDSWRCVTGWARRFVRLDEGLATDD